MGIMKDLTGQRFGRLIVIERLPDKYTKKGNKHIQWLCKCDCGNVVSKTTASLLHSAKSCGCLRNEQAAKAAFDRFLKNKGLTTEELIGMKFGYLEIEEVYPSISGNGGRTMAKTRCNLCGTTGLNKMSELFSGKLKACGCLRGVGSTDNILTGKRFGNLTVIKSIGRTNNGDVIWKCRCEKCGDYYDTITYRLINGITTECRKCSYKEKGENSIKDLTGKRFGKLVVEGFDSVKNHKSFWNCRCDCGKTLLVLGNSLVSGNTQSCGCWKSSRCEEWTSDYLEQHDYPYISQVRFDNLLGVGGSLLSYDFGSDSMEEFPFLIECQGKQHYEPIKYYGGEEKFETQQEHDKRKREYAKEHNIPLIEIPYTCNTQEKVNDFLDQELSRLGITQAVNTPKKPEPIKINPLLHKKRKYYL